MKKKVKSVAKKPARHHYAKKSAGYGIINKTLDPFPAPIAAKKKTTRNKS